MAVVDALVRGFVPTRPATMREMIVAVRHLAKHHYSDRQIGERIGRDLRTVQRIRVRNRIAGQPVGTNGFTRGREPLTVNPEAS